MNTPLLSIIIPFYNLEEWLLQRCLESIFLQGIEEKEMEVIIIDDGSHTSPAPFIHSLNKNNIYCHRQENQGLGGARNTGMDLAKGKYILFLDSDDYLYPGTLLPFMEVLRNQELDLVNFRFRTCYQRKIESIKQQTISFSPIISGVTYMATHNTPGSAALYIFKKELSTRHFIRFTPHLLHEDEEFTPRIYYFAQRIIVSNIVMYAYYQRENSIVRKKDFSHIDKRFRDVLRVIGSLIRFKEEQEESSTALQVKALERKIHFLVCDLIICMVWEHCPYSYISHQLQQLREMELYPLPNRKYSLKYNLFRQLANNKLGIRSLYFIEKIRTKTNR